MCTCRFHQYRHTHVPLCGYWAKISLRSPFVALAFTKAPSRIASHKAIIIARAISSSGIFVTKEPICLTRLDGKRPDRLTLIPWHGGKPLMWDVTVVSTLADSYLHATSHSAGAAAETAFSRKVQKYSSIPSDYIFQPVAFKTDGSLNASSFNLLRLTASSSDLRETSFLFQCLLILIQCFNPVLTVEYFISTDEDSNL